MRGTMPSIGAWISYGLGSESENLPAYVVMPQPEGTPEGGAPCWGAGFLPAVYQPTEFRGGSRQYLYLHWAYRLQNGLAVGQAYSHQTPVFAHMM